MNGNFMPCTFITKDGTTMVDFGKFHQIIRPEEEDDVDHLASSGVNETHMERIGGGAREKVEKPRFYNEA